MNRPFGDYRDDPRYRAEIEAQCFESAADAAERWADSLRFIPSFFWYGWSFRYRLDAAEARGEAAAYRSAAGRIRQNVVDYEVPP
jgi:hypothetical protein